MTFAVTAERVAETADDGLLDFSCPKCGKVVTRYHPSVKGKFQLKCPRTGSIGKNLGTCGWMDYVYFNVQPEELNGSL